MSSLDALVKEFIVAADDEKKAVFSKIEEEVEKLTGPAARYDIRLLFISEFYSTI